MSSGKRPRAEGTGPLVAHKRRRHPAPDDPPRYPQLKQVFEYPEVFLNILSFLPAQDLVRFESVSRYWKRICTDQWLWKRIYLARYPYPTSRQQRVLQPRRLHTGLPVSLAADSPSPSFSPQTTIPSNNLSTTHSDLDSERHQFFGPRIDWKLLTKIGTNWATGTAGQYSLEPSPSPGPGPRVTLGNAAPSTSSATRAGRHIGIQEPATVQRRDHLLALSPSFIFVAYPASPLLHVHSSHEQQLATQSTPMALIPPPQGWSSPSRPDLITCIKVDGSESPDGFPGVRLVVFYQSGGFVVLSVTASASPSPTSRVTWSRTVVHPPSDLRRPRRSNPRRGDPTVLAELCYPVLVGCTEHFYISVWRLPDPAVPQHKGVQDGPVLLQTLHSAVSFHPATLSLGRISEHHPERDDDDDDGCGEEERQAPERVSYRASLAYAVPLYPERWTLAIQDLEISLRPAGSGSHAGTVECGECFHVGRTTTGTKTVARRWPLSPRGEIVGVKGDRAIGIGLGETCCVLAGSDNQIQVYEIPPRQVLSGDTGINGRSNDRQISAARREIRHVQTLLAHSSAITAIALDQGRCVSAGNDGRVLVWRVDREADVLPADDVGDGEPEPAEEEEASRDWGGWVTVPPAGGVATDSPALKWSHVEVRTPQRSTVSVSSSSKGKDAGVSEVPTRLNESHRHSAATLHQQILPIPPVTHPLSLASAAREYLISPRTKTTGPDDYRAYEDERAGRVVEQLAFNDDRIVGLVRNKGDLLEGGEGVMPVDSVIKVWTFDV